MVDRGRTPTMWAKYDDPAEFMRTMREDRGRMGQDLGNIDRLVEAYRADELEDVLGSAAPARISGYQLVEDDDE